MAELKTYKKLDGPKGLLTVLWQHVQGGHSSLTSAGKLLEKEFGSVFRLKMAGIKLIVISNPEFIQKNIKASTERVHIKYKWKSKKWDVEYIQDT